MKTPLLIEQHFHGAYGVDFNKAKADDIISLAQKLLKLGIGGFFPTLVTDSVENINKQINEIKLASKSCPQILGIHLEGIFLNPNKKGIHNSDYFLELTIENFKEIEDDFIKIVTLAPELDKGLIEYLHSKNIKVQAGHCEGWGNVNGVTHTLNAMAGISHRQSSTALSALIEDNVYAEIIADGVHVSDEALKLFFKSKPVNKVILISDSLPITYSQINETTFADSQIFYDGKKAVSKSGTIAGSTMLLPEIIKKLASKGLFKPEFIENVYTYHNLPFNGEVEWDENFEIIGINYTKKLAR